MSVEIYDVLNNEEPSRIAVPVAAESVFESIWVSALQELNIDRLGNAEYKIDGVVFSDDGAGNPFIFKPDGAVVCFNAIDGEEVKASNSLSEFWTAKDNP